MVQMILTSRHHDIAEAADATQALHQMRAFGPDLILLDWHVNGVDCAATCREIRRHSSVPILVVSASESAREPLAAGASTALTKPIDVNTLLTNIYSLLSSSTF